MARIGTWPPSQGVALLTRSFTATTCLEELRGAKPHGIAIRQLSQQASDSGHARLPELVGYHAKAPIGAMF